jgi:SAM-dependent methyltransferase
VTIYDRIGDGYIRSRRPDPRIACQIRAVLKSAATVVNVGAGSGSYEPEDLAVVAVEPSVVMIAQRPDAAAPSVRAVAESLAFPDRAFDGGMAILTVHHWHDAAGGLRELRRVVRGDVAVLTWDQKVFDRFWMVADYVPASRRLDRKLPDPEAIAAFLGGGAVVPVLVPADCVDGFYAAWWRRPEAYLDPALRSGISGLARLDDREVEPGIERLRDDLRTGAWHERYGDLLDLEEYDAGYRLVIAPAVGPST